MSYKSITVCLDNSAGSERRLVFALALAAHFDAHLTGLHLTYSPLIMSDPYAIWTPMMLEFEEAAKDHQEKAKRNFFSNTHKAGVNANWDSYHSSDFRPVISQARAADLVIVGQRDPDDFNNDFGAELTESFVLKLGRPVLYFPYAGDFSTNFDSILVAWNGGREAARAMADALPFLKQAKRVTVLNVSEKIDDQHELPDIDIAAYLARHQVRVEIEKNENIDISPADWLLSRAADMDANLLVMGAYGHSRFSEMVFGGVTKSILRQMTLPVLMSH